MSIKEKVQQLVQQAEADKAAELRRQEEAQRQWLAECQEKTRQQEVLEKARFEKGKKALETTGVQNGVQRVLGEVFDVIREQDPEVELLIRKRRRYQPPDSSTNITRKISKVLEIYQDEEKRDRDSEFVDTVAMVVEKKRGEGKTTIRLGVEMEIDDPSKLWVISALGSFEPGDMLRINDKDLLPKLEERLAHKIVKGLHRHFIHETEDNSLDFGF